MTPPKLSIIIVNYNVAYFLEQCLHSVNKACGNINTEIFVVDNNSVDGSVALVKEKFPHVILIENKKNTGFSRANNQAIQRSNGEYILLLNPDTVVEEDTFEKIIRFMDQHPDAGALGVKMLDGKGNFLPESKRGLPTPSVAFFKIFGLAKLFPKSKIFGKYHLSFLNKDKIHEVDVLSGAFMLVRKKVLDKTGLLDEAFFMYGEDIDLSYRITLAGYKNYYFPNTRIIHYKGESTKKSSVNYVFIFYNAMIIFAQKHFSKKNARLFSFLINLAIYFRAGLALLNRFLRRAFLPLTDAAIVFLGFYSITNYYEQRIIVPAGGEYPMELISVALPLYILTWLSMVFLSGGYDKPIKLSKVIKGILIGTGIILIIYALLSENYRFSRALILLGALWALIAMLGIRILLHTLKIKNYILENTVNKRIIVVGGTDECKRVHALLKQSNAGTGIVHYVNHDTGKYANAEFIGTLEQIPEIIEVYKINEIIFCAKDLTAQTIINQMSLLGNYDVDYKIAPPESLSIIGSNSIDHSGELYVIDINSISKPVNIRNKRLLDLVISTSLLISLPLNIFFIQNRKGLIHNIFTVFLGRKTWVSYHLNGHYEIQNPKLPAIKKGVLNPTDIFKDKNVTPYTIERLNVLYAKDYKTSNDLYIIWKGFKKLGRKGLKTPIIGKSALFL